MTDVQTVLLWLVVSLLPAVSLALTSAEKERFSSSVIFTESSTAYTLSSNGIPSHDYGPFPSEDNPNSASEKNFVISVPKSPSFAEEEGCLPMGSIGMAINGVALYNPYTIQQTDAVVNEVMDDCGGHPSPDGTYHYHQSPPCVYSGGNNEFLGVALDGFPIYGMKDENGNELSSADLDRCHGRTHNGQYQYHMTRDFPYIIGCFKGSVSLTAMQERECSWAVADDYSGANTFIPSGLSLLLAVLFATQ